MLGRWKNPDNDDNPDTVSNSVEDGNTWTVGILWNDVIKEGNNLDLLLNSGKS